MSHPNFLDQTRPEIKNVKQLSCQTQQKLNHDGQHRYETDVVMS